MKLISLLDIQRYVRSVAAQAGLSVVYEDTPVPFTSPGMVHLPHIDKFTTDEQLAEYLYFIEHEAAHAAYSDFEVAGQFKKGTLSSRALGIVEDYRIDTKDTRWFDGFRMNRAEVLPKEVAGVRAMLDKALANPDLSAEAKAEAEKLVALHAWVTKHDETPAVRDTHETLLANDNIREWVIKLDHYADKLSAVVDGETQDSATLAREIIANVFGEDPSADEAEEPSKGEGDGGGEGGAEGKSEATGEGNEGADDGGLGNHYDHTSGTPQGVAKGKDTYTETRRVKIGYSKGKWIPCLPSEYLVLNLAEGDEAVLKAMRRAGVSGGSTYIKEEVRYIKGNLSALNGTIGSVEGFAQQVRRLLQIRARSRFEYGQKKGKLDQSRLARIGLKEAQGFNERIFKRKIIADTTDTAVLVLLDASGSMHGSRWAHAIKSAELINATVSRALGIPLEILAFTDDSVGTVMYEAKPFNELRVGDEELIARLSRASAYMSGNADGEAIAFAYDRLRKRKEKRKVLIVASDGAPSCNPRSHGRGGIDEYTKEVIQEIEADPKVDIYGLGIMSHSVDYYYTKHVVVKHNESLEAGLLNLIDKSIA